MAQRQWWHRLKAVGGKKSWSCEPIELYGKSMDILNKFSTCCFKIETSKWCEFSTECFQCIMSAPLALHCNNWKKSWHLQHYGHQGKLDQPKTFWSRCQVVEPWLSHQSFTGKLKPSKQVLRQPTNQQIPSAGCWSNKALPNTTKPWHQLPCWCPSNRAGSMLSFHQGKTNATCGHGRPSSGRLHLLWT